MKYRLLIPFVALLFLLVTSCLGQHHKSPRRELRGVWIASIGNIDYPRKPSTDPAILQKQWRVLLDSLKDVGINAVFVQVRTAGDALYKSSLVPWSHYLTGKQGTAPLNGFDPMPYLIAQAHSRGMEFHAWFNPYRICSTADTSRLHPKHVFNTHRNWVVEYGGQWYIDPGIPEATLHLAEVIREVTRKYDIDGVHLDDYIYPYPVGQLAFPDEVSYARYGKPKQLSLAAWRRKNTEALVLASRKVVKEEKPYTLFGFSPFGVWRNTNQDKRGSATNTPVTSYDTQYADVYTWLKNDWIDYVAPQLYWSTEFEIARYQTLLRWWNDNAFGHPVFIGHALHKVGLNPEPAWQTPNQIPKQLLIRRNYDNIKGSIFYNARALLNNQLSVRDSVKAYYRDLSLLPESMHKAWEPFDAPKITSLVRLSTGVKVSWVKPGTAKSQPRYYAIYRHTNEDPSTQKLIHVSPWFSPITSFIDKFAPKGASCTYQITALNRFHDESLPDTKTIR